MNDNKVRPKCGKHKEEDGVFYCPREEVFFCLQCDEDELHEGHYEGRRPPRADTKRDKWPEAEQKIPTVTGNEPAEMKDLRATITQAETQIERLNNSIRNIGRVEVFKKEFDSKMTTIFQNITEKLKEVQAEVSNPDNYLKLGDFDPEKIKGGIERLNKFRSYAIEQSKELLKNDDPKILTKVQEEYTKVQSEVGNPGFIADADLTKVDVSIQLDLLHSMIRNIIKIEPDFTHDFKQKLHHISESKNKVQTFDVEEQKGTTKNFDTKGIPTKFNSIMLENDIYIIGGEERSDISNWNFVKSVFVLKFNTLALERKGDMLHERAGHQLAYANVRGSHRIYIIGSFWPEDIAKKCEYYDIKAGVCIPVAAELNTARHSLGLTVIDSNFLYAIGGRGPETTEILGTFERLSLNEAGAKWELLAVTSTDGKWEQKYLCGAAEIGKNQILIFGGDYGWDNSSFILRTNNNQISKIEKANVEDKTAEFGCQNVIADKKWLYTVNSHDGHILKYSIENQRWLHLPRWSTDWEKDES